MLHPKLAKEIADVAQLSGSFQLRSGLVSTTYFDKYQFESDPTLLQSVAELMKPLVPPETELLAGLELGGVPIATALSIATGIPTVFVRKSAKEYGTAKLAEGPEIHGKNLLLIEDVVSTGGQILRSTADLRKRGAHISAAICAIDRTMGGVEALAGLEVKLHSLFTAKDLLDS